MTFEKNLRHSVYIRPLLGVALFICLIILALSPSPAAYVLVLSVVNVFGKSSNQDYVLAESRCLDRFSGPVMTWRDFEEDYGSVLEKDIVESKKFDLTLVRSEPHEVTQEHVSYVPRLTWLDGVAMQDGGSDRIVTISKYMTNRKRTLGVECTVVRYRIFYP